MVRFWVVRMTAAAEGENILDWKRALKGNFVGIGWSRMGNLSLISESDRESLKEELRNKYSEHCKEHERAPDSWAGVIITFVDKINIGDIVVIPVYPETNKGYEIKYMIGVIKTPAYYIEKPKDKAYSKNRRDVEWLTKKSLSRNVMSESLKKSLEAKLTVFNIDRHEEEIRKLIS